MTTPTADPLGDAARSAPGRPATPHRLVWLLVSVAAVAAIVGHFHDRFWWPPDDGVYAYVAQRVLRGDVLNGDVQDLHAGYVNLLHAAVLALLGEDIVSLRYPLALLTVGEAVAAYFLLAPRGAVFAATGAIGLGALTFVQFLNPSANWYALALFFGAAAALTWSRPRAPGRDVAIGALVVFTFLVRQLSGVFLAVGVVTWLLAEQRDAGDRPPRLARLIILVMAAGVAAYLWQTGSLVGFVMFGLWPLAALAAAWRLVRAGDAAVAALILRLLVGGALAALPLVGYHLYHGTLGSWIDDAFLTALHLTGLDFIGRASYADILVLALAGLFAGDGGRSVASGLFWIALLALPILVGVVVAIGGWRDTGQVWRPLPVLAVFHGLVSVHFQIPIYLFYSTGASLVALMWLAAARPALRGIVGSAVVALAAVGLVLQAGQPLSRGLRDIVFGVTAPLAASEGLPRARVAMEAADQALYRRLLEIIETHAARDEHILALPMNPELYFLSDRRPPFRFYSSALGLRDSRDLEEALRVLAATPPRLVIHHREDKYNTAATRSLLDVIKTRYALVEGVRDFDVYVRRPP